MVNPDNRQQIDDANREPVESNVEMEEVSTEINQRRKDSFRFVAEIDINDLELISQKIETELRERVADRRLSTTKESLLNDHPDFTAENLDGALLYIFGKKKEYEGEDLRKLIATLNNPDFIQSDELTRYIAVGKKEIAEHIANGGVFRFVICNKAYYHFARKSEMLSPTFLDKTPIILMHSISHRTGLGAFVGFKSVENNPFEELIEFTLGKIPANHFDNIVVKLKAMEDTRQLKEVFGDIKELVDLLAVEGQEKILAEFQSFFRENVGNRRIAWMKENILMKDPDASDEMVGVSLALLINKKNRFIRNELSEALAKQGDPTLIPSRDVPYYFSVGAKAISEHINGGGEFHLMVCNTHGFHLGRSSNIISRMLLAKVPVLLIKNLKDIFSCDLANRHTETLVGIKNVDGNPFEELVKTVLANIPDEYLKASLKFADEQASNKDIPMEIEIVSAKVKKDNRRGDDGDQQGVIGLHEQKDIMCKIQTFMESRVTNNRLAWMKANLVEKHLNWTADDVDGKMVKILRSRNAYAGKDLKALLATLNDPELIQSCELKKHFLVGTENVCKYLKNLENLEDGEGLHFILCSKNRYALARKEKIALQTEKQSIPVLPISGLRNMFSYDQNAPCDMMFGFLKTIDNPFQELVEFVLNKIPS